jgi:hypothetical protein
MSLRKVYGGTAVDGESRCDTCAHGQIIQGYAESERIALCTKLWDAVRIPFKVKQSTGYEERRLPDFEEMKEIAWQLGSQSAAHQAGFVSMEKLKTSKD